MKNALCIAILAFSAVSGCQSQPENSRHGNHSTKASEMATESDHAQTNVPTPLPVTAEDLFTRIKNSDARLTLINAWATWCKPCVEEMPELLEVAEEQSSRGFELMLVSADFTNRVDAVRVFLAEHDIAFQTYLKNQTDNEFVTGLHPEWNGALPGSFLVDSQGNVLDFWEGKASKEEFTRRINAAFATLE